MEENFSCSRREFMLWLCSHTALTLRAAGTVSVLHIVICSLSV